MLQGIRRLYRDSTSHLNVSPLLTPFQLHFCPPHIHILQFLKQVNTPHTMPSRDADTTATAASGAMSPDTISSTSEDGWYAEGVPLHSRSPSERDTHRDAATAASTVPPMSGGNSAASAQSHSDFIQLMDQLSTGGPTANEKVIRDRPVSPVPSSY